MSEYGPPCVSKDEENVNPDKKYYELMNSKFYEGCTYEIEN